jgi:DNA-binding Lrp family transcriptional regulator
MRPIATEQNSLRYPLNQLLGTPAHVRLLRILSNEVVGPITASDAAERAGLTEAGARRALSRLVKTGFVRRVGGGRSQQFALRDADPLAAQLIMLFQRENDRYQALLSGLRDILESLVDVRMAWIDAPPARVGEALHIGLIGDSESLSWVGDEIRGRIAEIEDTFELTIEVHRFTRADAPEVSWDDVTLLAGIPETKASLQNPELASHSDRDQRALRWSAAIASLLNRDPSLTRRATSHVERLLDEDQGAAAHDLREWLAILSQYSNERLREFLVSTTSRAQRLRQSTPFFAVLNPDERDEVSQFLEEQP